MALPARGALVRDAGPGEARGAVRRAHALPARPRPSRSLEAVPPAEGEDPGLHRPGGRPLPHPDDAHARDDGDLARRRTGAPAQRGPRRGDRARPRHGSYAVRPRRRAGARRCAQRRVRPSLSPQRAVVAHRPAAQPHPRGLRRDPHAHGRRRSPRRSRGRSSAIVDRVAYINHDIDDAIRYGILSDADLPRAEIDLLGSTGSERIDRLVHDLVEASEQAGDIRQSDEIGEAMLSLRAFMFDRVYLGPQVGPEHRRANDVVAGDLRSARRRPRATARRAKASSPTGSPTTSPV